MRSLAERNAAVIERVRAGNEKARMGAADRMLTEALRRWMESGSEADMRHMAALSSLSLYGCPHIRGASDA